MHNILKIFENGIFYWGENSSYPVNEYHSLNIRYIPLEIHSEYQQKYVNNHNLYRLEIYNNSMDIMRSFMMERHNWNKNERELFANKDLSKFITYHSFYIDISKPVIDLIKIPDNCDCLKINKYYYIFDKLDKTKFVQMIKSIDETRLRELYFMHCLEQ